MAMIEGENNKGLSMQPGFVGEEPAVKISMINAQGHWEDMIIKGLCKLEKLSAMVAELGAMDFKGKTLPQLR